MNQATDMTDTVRGLSTRKELITFVNRDLPNEWTSTRWLASRAKEVAERDALDMYYDALMLLRIARRNMQLVSQECGGPEEVDWSGECPTCGQECLTAAPGTIS